MIVLDLIYSISVWIEHKCFMKCGEAGTGGGGTMRTEKKNGEVDRVRYSKLLLLQTCRFSSWWSDFRSSLLDQSGTVTQELIGISACSYRCWLTKPLIKQVLEWPLFKWVTITITAVIKLLYMLWVVCNFDSPGLNLHHRHFIQFQSSTLGWGRMRTHRAVFNY